MSKVEQVEKVEFVANDSADAAEKMIEIMGEMTESLNKWTEKGNKSAAKRARAGSLAFAKVAKQFRKLSVSESAK